MKVAFAREFLWVVISIVVSIPVGMAFMWLLGLTTKTSYLTQDEEAMVVQFYLIGFIISFVGVYLSRFITDALKVVAKAKQEAAAALALEEEENTTHPKEIISSGVLKDQIKVVLKRKELLDKQTAFKEGKKLIKK